MTRSAPDGTLPHFGGTRSSRRILPVVFVGFLLAASSGCGYVLTSGPPPDHMGRTSFSCTEGNLGPTLDAVWGGLYLVGGMLAATTPDAFDPSTGATQGEIVAYGLLGGGLWGSSAIVGFKKTDRCRDAKRALRERQAEGQAHRRDSGDVPRKQHESVRGTARPGGQAVPRHWQPGRCLQR